MGGNCPEELVGVGTRLDVHPDPLAEAADRPVPSL